MDLQAYKGKVLDDAMLSEIGAAIESQTETLTNRALRAEEKARKAANESIEGRKGKDAAIAKALEKLGIDSLEELDDLPSAKGQADALKQFESKLKRAERERDEKSKAFDDLTSKYGSERRERALTDALAKHQVRPEYVDDVRVLIGARLRAEGDEFLFDHAGQVAPLSDGVAAYLKAKPEYVLPSGGAQHGSGFRGAKPGDAQRNTQANPFAKTTFNLTEQLRLRRDEPQLAEQMQAAAAGA